jgi:hypothetical protein
MHIYAPHRLMRFRLSLKQVIEMCQLLQLAAIEKKPRCDIVIATSRLPCSYVKDAICTCHREIRQ